MLDRRRALGLGVALAAVAGRRKSAAAQEAVGEVAGLEGSAAAIRGRGIVALATGDPVFVGDIVRTADHGRVLIRCRDGLRLVIGGGTEVALRAYLAGGTPGGGLEAAFGLLRGIVRLIGGELLRPQRIEVDTRTAVASVRSTEWLVEATERGTGVLAITGVVEVQGLAGGLVRLDAGEGTDVPPGGPPAAPRRWGDARRRDALARTSL